MPERLAPDALLSQINLTGAVTDIDEDPDTPDANWLPAIDTTIDTVARTSFPSPSQDLDPVAAAQEFRIQVRKTAAGGGTPLVDIVLYELGTAVSTLVAGVSITSETGQLVAVTWAATLLAVISGADVECHVLGSARGTGGSRRTVEVGAIEWNATVSAVVSESISDGVEAGDSFLGAYSFPLSDEIGLAGEAVTSVFAFFPLDIVKAGDVVSDNIIAATITGEVVITFT